jgi:hypothetical protein
MRTKNWKLFYGYTVEVGKTGRSSQNEKTISKLQNKRTFDRESIGIFILLAWLAGLLLWEILIKM